MKTKNGKGIAKLIGRHITRGKNIIKRKIKREREDRH